MKLLYADSCVGAGMCVYVVAFGFACWGAVRYSGSGKDGERGKKKKERHKTCAISRTFFCALLVFAACATAREASSRGPLF
jgi:hypothetical protein